MKNRMLFAIILIFTISSAQGQGETRIGVKGGITSSQITGPYVSQLSNGGNASSLLGFHLGIFINSKLKKNFWIKSEVLFNQKGATLQIKDKWNPVYSSNFKSQYVDLYPISPTFHWKGFQVLAGPYVGLLLSSTMQQKDSLGHITTTSSFGDPNSLLPYRQKLDAGFVIGAEYESKWGISIGVRYVRGYVTLFEHPEYLGLYPGAPPEPHPKIYNESLSFAIGYSFGKRKEDPPVQH